MAKPIYELGKDKITSNDLYWITDSIHDCADSIIQNAKEVVSWAKTVKRGIRNRGYAQKKEVAMLISLLEGMTFNESRRINTIKSHLITITKAYDSGEKHKLGME